MAYNYWVTLTYIPTHLIEENFGGKQQATQQSNDQVRSSVTQTLSKLPNYTEGEMSPELRKYFEETKNQITSTPVINQNQFNQKPKINQNQLTPKPITNQNQLNNQNPPNSKPIITQNQTTNNQNSALAQNIQKPTQQQPPQKQFKKSDKPEPGIIKLIIYHMTGCGHCMNIMDRKQNLNNMTRFEELCQMFSNDNSVQVFDFKYGRDNEASKYRAFPVILIVTSEGAEEYRGSHEVLDIAKAVINKK